jgi:hypothetical protein
MVQKKVEAKGRQFAIPEKPMCGIWIPHFKNGVFA